MSKVFISYRQTDEEQRRLVREFADRLRSQGVDVVLDQFFLDQHPAGPNEGWDKWSSDNALNTEFVLIVGSRAWFECFDKKQPPGTGLGAACEADDLRHRIYEAGGVIEGIRVVLFDDAEAAHIPGKLKRYHRFHAGRDFDNIVRWLTAEHSAQVDDALTGDRPRPDELTSYHDATIAKYEELVAGRSLISLCARGDSSSLVDARAELERLTRCRDSPEVVVLGDPGSGKTYLLRGLCCELSKAGDLLPVFIPAGQLRRFPPTTWEELLTLADPAVPPSIIEPTETVIVLDGLDELIGPRCDDQEGFIETLEAVGRVTPNGARLVYSCRSTTFEATSEAVTRALRQERVGDRAANDPTDAAIQGALQRRGVETVETLELAELSKAEARQYLLETSEVGSEPNPAIEYVLESLPRVPVILRFLQLALPELHGADGRTDLDELYTAAIRTWILRDPEFEADELDRIWNAIRFISDGRARQVSEDDLNRLVHAGLLTRDSRGTAAWSHASIGEFLFSLSLFEDLTKFNSSVIARLNLIGGYNINRFLVPQCRRAMSSAEQSGMVEPVTNDQYRRFLRATGWRSGTGYGMHPSYIAEDGTGFLSGTDDLIPEENHGPDMRGLSSVVSGLSWYDTFAYCFWSGQRLPNAAEVKAELPTLRDSWVWCSDWSDERKAHVAVVTTDESGKLAQGGVNPDVRHSRIGLVTVVAPRASTE